MSTNKILNIIYQSRNTVIMVWYNSENNCSTKLYILYFRECEIGFPQKAEVLLISCPGTWAWEHSVQDSSGDGEVIVFPWGFLEVSFHHP